MEYPTDKKINLFSALALSNASCPQGNQSTGLVACCNKYGDFSKINLFVFWFFEEGPASADIFLTLTTAAVDPKDPDLKHDDLLEYREIRKQWIRWVELTSHTVGDCLRCYENWQPPKQGYVDRRRDIQNVNKTCRRLLLWEISTKIKFLTYSWLASCRTFLALKFCSKERANSSGNSIFANLRLLG